MAYTTPRTWTTGETVTAAMMNEQVSANVADVYARANSKTLMINCFYENAAVIANNGTAIKTFTIPAQLNGALLTDADAAVYTAGTAGTVSIRLYNATDSQNMLTTNITIDANELTSYTAAGTVAISALYNGVSTGERIGIYVVDAASGTKGLDVMLTFTIQS
jgi:hypothetical protein